MDIEMPRMDGIEAAQRLRKMDRDVVLIFVTNMAKYAIKGYEVNAMSYILKPVNYFAFSYTLKRILQGMPKRDENFVLVPIENGEIRLSSDQIWYIEVLNHRLLFHTKERTYEMFGTLQKMEERFRGSCFVKCNKSYLVNLKFVARVEKNMVRVGENELQISRPRRKDFLMALTEYYGHGGT